jgi:riboflavin kinase/FMN adenylyltransferase
LFITGDPIVLYFFFGGYQKGYDFMIQNQIGCIGNFDGVHLGHQALIRMTQKIATEQSLKPTLITFQTNTKLRNVLSYLTTAHEKYQLIHNLGLEKIVQLEFPGFIAEMTPEEFVEHIIVHSLQMTHVIVGENFCFGKNRSGSSETLKQIGKKRNIGVTVVPLENYQGEPISSTNIRNNIDDGNLEIANAMLGYPFFNQGIIIPGKKRGRTMGIPTANLHPRNSLKKNPKDGVYITQILLNGELYPSLTHIGPKPTFEEMDQGIETHLLNHSGNFYSQHFVVLWLKRLRNIQQFSSGKELVGQIQKDIQSTHQYFQKHQALTSLPSILQKL